MQKQVQDEDDEGNAHPVVLRAKNLAAGVAIPAARFNDDDSTDYKRHAPKFQGAAIRTHNDGVYAPSLSLII